MPILQERFDALSCCVIVPTYNNDHSLRAFLTELVTYTNNIIVINDGSTDTTNEILKDFESLDIVLHDINRGKGIALKTGFKRAEEKAYEYAITIDSDGQHYPADLEKFLVELENRNTRKCMIELRNNISQIFLREGIFNDLETGLTILIDKRISKLDLEGIFIYDTREKNKEIDIFAKKGRIILTSSGPLFQLVDGNRREVKVDGTVLNELSFKNYSINIAKKQINPKFRWLDANEKTIFNLLQEDNINSIAEAHFRLAYPILTITLPLIAVVSFFCFPNSYSNQVYLISSSLLLSFFIQLLLISMRRVIIINPSLWFIFYLIPIIPIFIPFTSLIMYGNKFFEFNSQLLQFKFAAKKGKLEDSIN